MTQPIHSTIFPLYTAGYRPLTFLGLAIWDWVEDVKVVFRAYAFRRVQWAVQCNSSRARAFAQVA